MTLNQQYKASGANLSFKDWLEKQKMLGLVPPKMEQEFNFSSMKRQADNQNANFTINVTTQEDKRKNLMIGLGVVALIGVGFIAYKKLKK
jgi:secreted trypsin-like serine protease